jgi:hypothetical protein
VPQSTESHALVCKAMPQPTILSCRCVASEAGPQPTHAPYTAAGSKSANLIHPAGAAKTSAASR